MVPNLSSSPSRDTSSSCLSPEDIDILQTPIHDQIERYMYPTMRPFHHSAISPFRHGNLDPRNNYDPRVPTILSPLPSLFLSPSEKRKAIQSNDQLHSPMFICDDLSSDPPLDIDPFSAVFHAAQCSSDSPRSPSLLLHQDGDGFKLPGHSVFPRRSLSEYYHLSRDASSYSLRFPAGHKLDRSFVNEYQLGEELGKGGYGFVMTARHRREGSEVAVKFIIKSKVPEDAWMETEDFTKPLPSEVVILNYVEHDNIVKCMDLFEDPLYFYMVQELHGSPWHPKDMSPKQAYVPNALSLPSLSPSGSADSITDSEPSTPSELLAQLSPFPGHVNAPSMESPQDPRSLLQLPARLDFPHRPSHDLFEYIEQSKHKRLPEDQARYIFAQVVEAVYYLDSVGIAHRDIKDENLLIDGDLKVKLIDFGSAIAANPDEPRPYYNLFFGTTAYAASEILLKKPYQAAPAEVWTLGILLSYLMTGTSPFSTQRDAVEGNICLNNSSGVKLSKLSVDLLRRCLNPNPARRATIKEVRKHRWLHGALSR